jgi:hypothetical protein
LDDREERVGREEGGLVGLRVEDGRRWSGHDLKKLPFNVFPVRGRGQPVSAWRCAQKSYKKGAVFVLAKSAPLVGLDF